MSENAEQAPIEVEEYESDVFRGPQIVHDLGMPALQERQENTRSVMAFTLVWTFTGIVTVALLASIFGPLLPGFSKELLSETLRDVIPPAVALVGSVTGFYFGSKQK